MVELRRYGTERCQMMPRSAEGPLIVIVHGHEAVVTQKAFDSNDDACDYAIEQLRRATAVTSRPAS